MGRRSFPRTPGTWTMRRRPFAGNVHRSPGDERGSRMTTQRIPLTRRTAWRALETHHATLKDVHLRKLFADDPKRGERLTLDAVGLYLDYSKNRVTDETMQLLVQ